MSLPSPKSHLYRLAGVLLVALVAFLFIKSWAQPDSWDFEHWYRRDSLNDMTEQPLAYGGNESCLTCHEDSNSELLDAAHNRLSCESCHGALADHVQNGEKTADAFVDESTWQCLNCHDDLVTKPKGFPVFRKDKSHAEMNVVEEGIVCSLCHAPHDPTL